MIRRWKVYINITMLDQFETIVIVKGQTVIAAKNKAYNKAKIKYPNANNITIASIKEV